MYIVILDSSVEEITIYIVLAEDFIDDDFGSNGSIKLCDLGINNTFGN